MQKQQTNANIIKANAGIIEANLNKMHAFT